MAGKKPDYRACVVEENGNGSFYTDIGAGWDFATEKAEGISVKLRKNIAVSGEIVLFRASEE